MYDNLQNFKVREFGSWAIDMDYELLVRADMLRNLLGTPMIISMPEHGGLGRRGPGRSFHCVDTHGTVMAMDFYLTAELPPEAVRQSAVIAGLGGIGVYFDWRTQPIGYHIDVGPRGRSWSRVDGQYMVFSEGVRRVLG